MASSIRRYVGSFVGALADVTIATCPFQPEEIRFTVNAAGDYGLKTSLMPTNVYVSHLGADTGVTITSTGFTVANGADVNSNGVTTHFVCEAA